MTAASTRVFRSRFALPIHIGVLLTSISCIAALADAQGSPKDGSAAGQEAEPPLVDSLLVRLENAAAGASVDAAVARATDPYRSIREEFNRRLNVTLAARRSDRPAVAESARVATERLARVTAVVYKTPALVAEERWARNLTATALDSRARAESLLTYARSPATLEDRQSAWEAASSSEVLFRSIGDRRGVLRASIFSALCDPDRNRERLRRRWIEIADSLLPGDDPLIRSYLCHNLCLMAVEQEDLDAATVELKGAQSLVEWLNDDRDRLETQRCEARLCVELGRLADAKSAYFKAAATAERLGRRRAAAQFLEEISEVFLEEGALDSADAYSARALAMFRELDDREGTARRLNASARREFGRGRVEEALRLAEEAGVLAREQRMTNVELSNVRILSEIHYALGNLQEARRGYSRGRDIAEALGVPSWRIGALTSLSVVELRSDSLDAALRYVSEATVLAESLLARNTDWWSKGHPLLLRAYISARQGDSYNAERFARLAFDVARDPAGPASSRHSGTVVAGAFLGSRLMNEARLTDAQEVFEQVAESASALGNLADLAYARGSLGWIAWQRGDSSRAIEALATAVDELELRREAFGPIPGREQWFRSALWPFERMVAFLIERLDPEHAFEYFERMKSRELLDLLAGGHVVERGDLSEGERAREHALLTRVEGLNYRLQQGELSLSDSLRAVRAEYADFEERLFRSHPGLRERRGQGKPVQLSDAQRLLREEEAALLYTMSSEDISLLVVTKDGIQGVRLGAKAADVRERVARLSQSLRRPEFDYDREVAQDLYRDLVAPVVEQLSDYSTLCFVPDNELYSIPWGALIDPDSGRFLIERWSTYVAPSLSALVPLRRVDHARRRTVLAVGAPLFEQPPSEIAALLRGKLTPLPGARQELRELQTIYGERQTTLTGAEATEAAFERLAPQYDVLHVASHALFDDANALSSSIALARADGTPPGRDGFLEAREIMRLRLRADLVVLSACETARGDVTTGEGLNGFLRALFAAGVPSIVASQWPVSDEFTVRLMTRFHQNVEGGMELLDALRDAELASMKPTLAPSESRERGLGTPVVTKNRVQIDRPRGDVSLHPFYWAGFTLYGLPN